MSRYVLTTRAVITCPHGGVVSVEPTATRVIVDGDVPLRLNDVATITGCTFNVSGSPSPCVRAMWSEPSARVRVEGDPVLAHDSVAVCLNVGNVPQGTAGISGFQTRVRVR